MLTRNSTGSKAATGSLGSDSAEASGSSSTTSKQSKKNGRKRPTTGEEVNEEAQIAPRRNQGRRLQRLLLKIRTSTILANKVEAEAQDADLKGRARPAAAGGHPVFFYDTAHQSRQQPWTRPSRRPMNRRNGRILQRQDAELYKTILLTIPPTRRPKIPRTIGKRPFLLQ